MSKMLNKYAIIKKFVARNFLRFLSLFYYIYSQNLFFQSKKPGVSRKSTLGFVDILAKSRKKLKKEKDFFWLNPVLNRGPFAWKAGVYPLDHGGTDIKNYIKMDIYIE